VDLDEVADGDTVQDYLVDLTGSRSVPKVFIGGELVGGMSRQLSKLGSRVPENYSHH
jgi:glutaredoxin